MHRVFYAPHLAICKLCKLFLNLLSNAVSGKQDLQISGSLAPKTEIAGQVEDNKRFVEALAIEDSAELLCETLFYDISGI